MCERGTWTQVFPYVDRLNYVSPMLNNVGYALAVEKLCDIQVPDRCQWYRMILGELARISDHLTCNGAMAMELGAFTPFLWMIKGRELIWDLMEEETGARLTHSFGRVGGMAQPPTAGFKENARAVSAHILEIVAEVEKLLLGNRIFLDRLENVGVISAADAISLGWTGPCLRASGIPYDVRKSHPYMKYGDVECRSAKPATVSTASSSASKK
jgi:NADH-quinone oxidoreductase subunit D